MISEILKIQEEVLSKNYNLKKELGQFFTDANIANYMSSMIDNIEGLKFNDEVRILDAGAGIGVLSIAAVIQCLNLGYKNLSVILYEIDINLISTIDAIMKRISDILNKKIFFKYELLNEDFVLVRPDKETTKYHLSIINPPYFKYSVKNSKYSKATSDLFKGDPNIYASFMAITINCLENNGQMIVIVPRSFTNGLYFKNFRAYIESISSFESIHIFKSRNKLFKKGNVLQENIICKFIKKPQSKKIKIISSNTLEDLDNADINEYDSSFIIDKVDNFSIIYIPETSKDAEIMCKANSLESNFSKEKYTISTGKIVDFRSRDLLVEQKELNALPLYRAANVQMMKTVWDNTHKHNQYFKISDNHEKVTLPNNIYILLRRLSSKDEKKRLIASVYVPDENEFVAIDNKLNYISKENESFNIVEATGMCALLNSTFMDEYFRCFSGNTQVNATEIRIMKFLGKDKIILIGKEILEYNNITQNIIDEAVNKFI